MNMESGIPEKLSSIQEQVLIGSLLGDGHLTNPKKQTHNSLLVITRQLLDENYLRWQHSIFEKFCPTPPYISLSSFSKKYKKRYQQIGMYSRSSNIFSEYRKIWYPNKIKIVPKNFDLTSLIVAVWLADDGTIQYGKNKQSLKLTLATHSFSIDDVMYLIDLLNKRYNECFHIAFDFRDGKKYPIICGANKATRTLLQDIDLCFPLERKSNIWRDKDVCFYEQIPKARVSKFKI